MFLKRLRYFLAFILTASIGYSGKAQTGNLSPDECYQLAKSNYPAIKKLNLIARTSEFDIQNANKRFLPQVVFSGQATYQSETINFADALGTLPITAALPSISKDQYKVLGEIDQLLYDGGITRNQKTLIAATAALQEQNLESNLYTLKQRIISIYFGILLIDAQLRQNQVNKANLQSQVQKTGAALDNGIAFRSNVDELKAEIVTLEMGDTEYEANRTAYLKMLSLLIGKELANTTQFAMPTPAYTDANIIRPELKAFDLQQSIYDAQEKQLRSDYLPQVTAFFQGAYGRPTLNIIKNKFGPWYLAGVKFNWSLGSLYSLSNKRNSLGLNRQSVEADRESFLLNTKVDLTQQDEQVRKYTTLIKQDEEAIALRESVKKSADAQLNNGVITTHEYIQKLSAEHLARQALILHQTQLLQAQYNQQYITGN